MYPILLHFFFKPLILLDLLSDIKLNDFEGLRDFCKSIVELGVPKILCWGIRPRLLSWWINTTKAWKEERVTSLQKNFYNGLTPCGKEHKDTRMTRRYAHITPTYLSAALERLEQHYREEMSTNLAQSSERARGCSWTSLIFLVAPRGFEPRFSPWEGVSRGFLAWPIWEGFAGNPLTFQWFVGCPYSTIILLNTGMFDLSWTPYGHHMDTSLDTGNQRGKVWKSSRSKSLKRSSP